MTTYAATTSTRDASRSARADRSRRPRPRDRELEQLRQAITRVPKQTPLEREAQALRTQEAIDLIRFPDLYEVPPLERPERESLLAAVVWPSEQLLDWSLERARAKLHRLT